MSNSTVVLSPPERHELSRRAGSPRISAGDAKRARLLLLLAEGKTYDEIRETLGCSSAYISRWKKRFLDERLAGLYRRYRGAKPSALTPELEAQILACTRRSPPDGAARWSTRRLAKHLGINHMLVHRAWKRSGFRPRQKERSGIAEKLDFQTVTLDILGLFLNPPAHAAVFGSVAGRALPPRARKLLPFPSGERARRPRHRDLLPGASSLLTAIGDRGGHHPATTAQSHNSAELVAFVGEIVAHRSSEENLHVLVDSLAVHKTKRVVGFLEAHPGVRLHPTPTYSSWLAKIERWLAGLGRDFLARDGVFDSVDHLRNQLMHFIGDHEERATIFKWAHAVSKRSSPFDSTVTNRFDPFVTNSSSIVTVGQIPTEVGVAYDSG